MGMLEKIFGRREQPAALLDAMAMRQFKWAEMGARLTNEGKSRAPADATDGQ